MGVNLMLHTNSSGRSHLLFLTPIEILSDPQQRLSYLQEYFISSHQAEH
ncbi:MAG TPA: hypothetical protein V6C85_28675 [Allocoleopsis sp.]